MRYGNDPNTQSCSTKHKSFRCCNCCTRWSLCPSKDTMLCVHSPRSQRDFWAPNRRRCSNPHFQGSLSLRTGSIHGRGRLLTHYQRTLHGDSPSLSSYHPVVLFPTTLPRLQVVPGTLHCRNFQRTDGPFHSGRSSHKFSPALSSLFLSQL